MAKKKKVMKHNTVKCTAKPNPNLPTHERRTKNEFTIRNNIAQVEAPLRIDKLLRNDIINEMQHLYGMQVITLWTIASRSYLKTMQYERVGTTRYDFDHITLSRMNAEDQFYKTMHFMRQRDRDLIYKICIEEKAAIEAGKSLNLPVNNITVYVRAAFDALGEALARMRAMKKEIEKPAQQEEKEWS